MLLKKRGDVESNIMPVHINMYLSLNNKKRCAPLCTSQVEFKVEICLLSYKFIDQPISMK